MIEIKGKYNTAKVYTDNVEEEAVAQIKEMCDMEYLEDCKIRIMPDVHAGKGCTIGTTIKIKDKVCPNYVGVDIGCGVLVISFYKAEGLDLEKVDKYINENIPSGMNIHDKPISSAVEMYLTEKLNYLRCDYDLDRALRSVGTLGGGNHFIEISKGREKGKYYLVIHTGSRHLGLEVAKHYQDKAYEQSNNNKQDTESIIKELKEQGRDNEIEQVLLDFKKDNVHYTKDNAYVSGKLFDDYVHDIKFIQDYARINRRYIADMILDECIKPDYDTIEWVCDTIHNYIDTETMILRKGSVRAKNYETFILPLNMRDGSLLCAGKGNEDWNCSAPHGAGRILSRTKAKQDIDLAEYKKEMEGIYSTSVCEETIDESPMAYKDSSTIEKYIIDTAVILERLKPIYNFKAKN